ncbi:MAG TPA: hypothetical protein VHC72_14280 [Bryobacteraceae bacterium]|nr:hypothetical protein [Bryobacteraceae bacterium]
MKFSMKSLQTIGLLFAAAGMAAAQQYTISTVAGIPGVAGLYPVPGDVTPTPATSAQLYHPATLAADSKGNFYIGDYFTYIVRMVTASSGNTSIIAGNGQPGSGGDNDAATSANVFDVHGIAVDGSGNVYFSDTSTCRVRKVDNPAGNTAPKISTFVGNTAGPFCGPTAHTTLGAPAGLAFDSKGNLYIADFANSVVYQATGSGTLSVFAGNGTYGASGDGGPANKASLAAPVSLAIDSAGNLYIGDVGNLNIRKVDTSGNISTVVAGVAATALGVDAAGNFYFVDGNSSTVRKALPGGGVVTIAGNGYTGSIGDGGAGSLAQVSRPAGLAVMPDGSILIADTGNNTIRKLSPVDSSVGVQDSASEVPGSYLRPGNVSPGELLTLFGAGLGPATLTTGAPDANGQFPTQLAGTSVTFNSIPAPIIYTSSGLVSVVAPYGISGSPDAAIAVSYQGKTYTATMPVAPVTPAVFTFNASGTGTAAALNQDQTINSVSNPAKTGTFITLYATGAGYTTTAADGKTAPTNCGISCLGRPLQPVAVKIGNQCVIPAYAGDAPALVAGVMQVNAQIPASTLPGSVPVQVVIGSNCNLLTAYPSQDGVTISVTQ